MSRTSGLGRGLGALIPAAAPGQSGFVTVPTTRLRPNPKQPRERFDETQLDELAQSIRQVGILQPIVARPVEDGTYEIIAGERRFRAAKIVGLEEVPVVVRHTEDAQLLTEALVENVHRADLDPIEEAIAYRQLIEDFDISHEALSERMGKSRSAISNSLRLLSLTPHVQELVSTKAISAGHARALVVIDDDDEQDAIATRIIADGLSVRKTEELVKERNDRRSQSPEELMQESAAKTLSNKRRTFSNVEDLLTDALSTEVQIKGSLKRGKVVVHFSGPEDLERLIEIFGQGTGKTLFK